MSRAYSRNRRRATMPVLSGAARTSALVNGQIDTEGLVLESSDGRVVGVEVKAGQTPKGDWFRWLSVMRDALGERFIAGVVLYTGSEVLPFGERLLSVPVQALWET